MQYIFKNRQWKVYVSEHRCVISGHFLKDIFDSILSKPCKNNP